MSIASARPAPLSRSERQQQTRRALLDAAQAVVAERGILGATHAEIARAAGVTVGAIYSNFASKADLMVTMLEDAATGSTMFRADCATVADCLDDLARRLVAQADEHPELTVLSLEFILATIRDPETRARRLPQRQAEHAAYARLLEDIARRSGETLPLPAVEFVEVVTNLGWALLCSRAMLGPDVITDQLVVDAMRLCAR